MRAFLLFFVVLCTVFVVQGEKIQVHVVPHTHDDVGWLKTVDQYFMGSNNSIQHAGVQYVLDSVYHGLEANPERRFSYVEMAFFVRWFRQQTEEVQKNVQKLVKEGRLSFMNGGWCMHDEANTHYMGMIDQTTLGHQHIVEMFGSDALPTVGWQIDPFGHSASQGSYMTHGFGFDGLVVGRIDYQDRALRTDELRMETIWRPSQSFDPNQQVFLSCDLGGNYQPPEGLCFDQFCADPPVQDDPRLFDYNVEERVDTFVQRAVEQANVTIGKHIIFKMGSDFQYENANEWFKNLDKLLYYVNQDGRVDAFYSTPTAYIQAKTQEKSWPLKTDDFFPYADNSNAYWTGYYTSRATLKGMARQASSTLQAAKQLQFWGGNATSVYKTTKKEKKLKYIPFGSLARKLSEDNDNNALTTLEEAVAVVQHHDAVAGTSKQHVAYDYMVRLASGLTKAEDMMSKAMGRFMGDDSLKFKQCSLLNVSVCEGSSSEKGFMVVMWNPSSSERRANLERIPVNGPNFEVFDSDGKKVPSSIIPTFQTSAVQKEKDSLSHTLFFEASISALGWNTYFVMPSNNAVPPKVRKHLPILENEHLAAHFDMNGELRKIINKKTGLETTMEVGYEWYESFNSTNVNDTQNSGAYIFRPAQNFSHPISPMDNKHQVYESVIVSEYQKQIQPWIYRTYRLSRSSLAIEVETTVGPVAIDDNKGKEVIIKYKTDIQSKDTFYTDSNGREMQERILNYRPTWNVSLAQPVAGNYYPINAAAYLKDSKAQFSVVNDRAQGCASLASGQVEIMIHRRTLADDARGVGEPLNETEAITDYPDAKRIGYGLNVTTTHKISLESSSPNFSGNGNEIMRDMMAETFHKTQYFFAPLPASPFDWAQQKYTKGTKLGTSLPGNVQIETIQIVPTRQPEQQQHHQHHQGRPRQQLGGSPCLLRLGHKFSVGESPAAVPVEVDIAAIFAPQLKVAQITEKNLAGMPLREMEQWSTTGQPTPYQNKRNNHSRTDDFTVTINPMEIRTYVVEFA